VSTERRPWGLALGILVASAITLLGIWRDIEPLRILFRAGVAGIVAGATVSVLCAVMSGSQQEV
jgi:hypothetical protein